MTAYSKIIDLLLRNIVDIAKKSHLPKITQNLTAYVDFLYFKEAIGLQRALGVEILSFDEISNVNRIKMAKLVSMREQYFFMFTNYASKDILSYYNEIAKIKLFKTTSKIENSIIYQKSLDKEVSSRYWYELKTQELALLSRVSKYTKIRTLDNITQELKYSKIVFVSMFFLILLSIGIFSLMVIAFLRLAKEEGKLRMVLDKYIITSITDLKGVIIDASDAFCDISGYSKKELIGKNHNIVRHPSMDKKVFEEIWRTIKKGNAWKGKVKNLKKDGSFYWVYSNIEPLYDLKGNIDSYISVRLDITESELLMGKIKEEEAKNKMQEELMQHQHRLAQMGEMLSMIAHQWRQPLSAINATAGVIKIKVQRNKLDTQTALMLSEKIVEFSNHLSSTIDDFRDFFKPNKVKSETNFKMILDSVLQISDSSLEKNRIILTQNIKKVENFVTYENELKQVLLNLLKNAEDAIVENSIKNPEITVEIDGNCLILSDNAGGISEDNMSKIFNPSENYGKAKI